MAAKLIDAPMAFTSGSDVVVNVTHLDSRAVDPKVLVEHALRSDRPVFIGVVVLRHEIPGVLRRVDDALAEVASTVAYRDRG